MTTHDTFTYMYQLLSVTCLFLHSPSPPLLTLASVSHSPSHPCYPSCSPPLARTYETSQEALSVLTSIKKRGLAPDHFTFTTLLMACGRTGNSDKVRYAYAYCTYYNYCTTEQRFIGGLKKVHNLTELTTYHAWHTFSLVYSLFIFPDSFPFFILLILLTRLLF